MTALPEEITTAAVTWDVQQLARDGATGDLILSDLASAQIVFTATPSKLLEQGTTKTIILPAPIVAPLSAGTQDLIRTDCAAVSPGAWTWGAMVQSGALSVDLGSFALDDTNVTDDTADLAMITPLPQANGTPITRGPKGDTGDPVGDLTLTDAGDGTASFTYDSTTVAVPILTDGKVDTSVIPPLAITSVTDVASQAAMLALTGVQVGDVAHRTDDDSFYMLGATDPSTLANWIKFSVGTGVVSVNSKTGVVTLTASDVSALGDDATASDVGAAANTQGGAEQVTTGSATTGTVTLDCSTASVFTITPTGNITLAPSNVPGSGTACTITVVISMGSTLRTVTMPGGAIWLGAAPTFVASKKAAITMLTTDGGTSWICSAGVQA